MNEQIIYMEIITWKKIASLRILILIRNESQQDNIISLEHDITNSEIRAREKILPKKLIWINTTSCLILPAMISGSNS